VYSFFLIYVSGEELCSCWREGWFTPKLLQ
jgi:hypothetical protein